MTASAGPGGVFAIIGIITVSVAVVKTIQFASIHLRPSRLSRYVHTTNGQPPWALVTGASDGIGRGFAAELAKQGLNIVLHGRNHAKLSRIMSHLQDQHPERSFRILIADASKVACLNCIRPSNDDHGHDLNGKDTGSSHARPDFDAIRAELDGLNLTVLINNVGGNASNPSFSPLIESPEERIIGNVSLNALFPMHLTRVLLPTLQRNAPALVVNVSSISDDGMPLIVSYSSSKSFLRTMTEALVLEMKLLGRGSDVELLGVRVAKTTNTAYFTEKPSLFTPDSQTMARAALQKAGNGYGIVAGYWSHALLCTFMDAIPRWFKDKIFIAAIMRANEADKKRG